MLPMAPRSMSRMAANRSRARSSRGCSASQAWSPLATLALEEPAWPTPLDGTLDALNQLAEEHGLQGIILLVGIYLLILLRGFWIGAQAQTSFGRMMAGSLTLTFFVYIFVNMGMVAGLLPVVGVPLPLVSAGGTSVVTLLAGFGVLMAISTEKASATT